MAAEVTGTPMEVDDEAYISSEDEDFDPSAANADENVSSSSEEEPVDAASKQKKSKTAGRRDQRGKNEDAEDIGFENSGDEATIKKAKDKVAKRKKKSDAVVDENSSGGEGGFIKTRSMRAVQAKEREKKPLASADGATIDVEALWKSMNAPNTISIYPQPTTEPARETAITNPKNGSPNSADTQVTEAPAPKPSLQGDPNEVITIQIATLVSGKLHHKPSLVKRSSPLAQRYLRTQQLPSRPLKRVSKWDPNPDGIIPPLSSMISLKGKKNEKSRSDGPKMKKLNFVEKSHLDWVAHVAEVGDKDDLEQAAKAKGGFLERADFLGRVEMNREEELRSARRK